MKVYYTNAYVEGDPEIQCHRHKTCEAAERCACGKSVKSRLCRVDSRIPDGKISVGTEVLCVYTERRSKGNPKDTWFKWVDREKRVRPSMVITITKE